MNQSQPLALPRKRAITSIDLLMMLMVVIWGVNYSVIKVALQTLPPFTFNFLRFTLATLLMVALLRIRGETLWVARRDIPAMLLLGLTGHGVYQLFFISGLARSTATNTSLILAAMPIFAAVVAHITGVERASRTVWAGIVLSFVGILVLILGDGKALSFGAGTLAGDLMILTAAVLWAIYLTVSKPLLTRYSPVKVTTMLMVIGTPPLLLAGLPGMLSQNWQAVPPAAWGGVLYSAVLSTVVAYVLWTMGVQRIGNARTAVYSNVTPIITALAAWIILGDRLQTAQVVGAAIVFGGLILTRRGRTH